MKKSRWLALLALLSAVMLLAAACGGDDDDGENGGDAGADDIVCYWVIGTMGALSGDNATIGQPIFQGIEFAVEELNEAGDLPCTLELVDEDSQGDPAQAPPLAQSLVENEELVAIVGPYFSGLTREVRADYRYEFLVLDQTLSERGGLGWVALAVLVDELEGARQVAGLVELLYRKLDALEDG